MFDRRLIAHFDFTLFFTVLLICSLGILNLNSLCSSEGNIPTLFYKQLSWMLIGLFFLLIIININYVTIIRYGYYFHAIALFLVLLVLFVGKTKFGSQRWLALGPLSLQPSELIKITFMLSLSKFFAENLSHRPYNLQDLFAPFLLLLITFVPIYVQPDLGTAGIICLIFASYLFFLNINKKMFYPFLGLCMAILPCLWFVLKDYQKQRILVFLDPDLDPLHAGYQLIQSKIAVGSGGFFGKGFRLGTQSQLRFLPEQHTDFVFSVWSEEWSGDGGRICAGNSSGWNEVGVWAGRSFAKSCWSRWRRGLDRAILGRRCRRRRPRRPSGWCWKVSNGSRLRMDVSRACPICWNWMRSKLSRHAIYASRGWVFTRFWAQVALACACKSW